MDSPDQPQEPKDYSKFPASWNSMTDRERITWAEQFIKAVTPTLPKYDVRWFIGKGVAAENPYGVMHAEFDGKILISQKKWDLGKNSHHKWETTNLVGDWYFVGEDSVWPCEESEAVALLPAIAMETVNNPVSEISNAIPAKRSFGFGFEGNPYDAQPVPHYFWPMTSIITKYLERQISPWTLEAYFADPDEAFYVQAITKSPGSFLCEAIGNKYMHRPLNDDGLAKLKTMGWQLADGQGFLNHWFTARIDEGAENIAKKLVRAFVEVYGVSFTYSFRITPHPDDVGIDARELGNY